MNPFSRVFSAIGHGIGGAFKGLSNIGKGLLTLDLKKAARGATGIVHGGLDVGRGLVDLTPAGLAGNTLLNGGTDKIVRLAQKPVRTVVDHTIKQTANFVQDFSAVGQARRVATTSGGKTKT